MSRLTVTEKEHWKDRIEGRINKRIDELTALDSKRLSSITAAAEKAAYESLGISKEKRQLVTLKSQIDTLSAKVCQVEKSIVEIVLGDIGDDYYRTRDRALDKAVRSRRGIHEQEFLAESTIGKKILALRVEKEELLDTIWLATSNVQVQELWSRVVELLGDKPTRLQEKTLSATPVDDD